MCFVSESPEAHWEQVYRSRPADKLSWFQTSPTTSVRLVESGLPGRGSVLDVGAGSSALIDELLAASFEDLTVLDVSGTALDSVRRRLAERGQKVNMVQADLLEWEPVRTFDVWHDRAVFHFLTRPEDRSRYVQVAATAVRAGETLIVATFASDGPTQCSGLPVSRYDATELAARRMTCRRSGRSCRPGRRSPPRRGTGPASTGTRRCASGGRLHLRRFSTAAALRARVLAASRRARCTHSLLTPIRGCASKAPPRASRPRAPTEHRRRARHGQ
jgi:hypothetical protein